MFFVFYLSALWCLSQNIDSTLQKYADNFGQERIYLQYDKSTYVPGETIWFKAYLMNGFFPVDSSRNFYADWTDSKGNLLFRTISPVIEGTANGQFDIPKEYSGKFIHVKAYTRWMLNFDSAFLYDKDIVILGQKGNSTVVRDTIVSSLQFFPEGGDIIESVNNKIAFKANDQWGRPVKVKGIIQNNAGKVMDSIKARHDGMGYFFVLPQPGESFTAIWKDENGKDHSTKLPGIKKDGVSIQVLVSGSRRIFEIDASPGAAATLHTVNLIGTMRQREIFKVSKDISTGSARGIIPTQNLPSGILTITVFDDKWKPLAERITYINNQEYFFKPEMTVQHWGLNKRAKNEIVITVPDSLQANLAVSVTDAGIDVDSSDNIISHLLLTGDLKGQVYNPGYYFSDTSNEVSQNLDLVMLTHGWRRFNWEEVVKGKLPGILYPKDTSYLTLSGKVYGVIPSDLKGTTIIMIVSRPKQGGDVVMLPIENDGTFNDPSLLVIDTVRVYYQLPKKHFRDASVRFMEDLLPPLRSNIPAMGIYYNGVNDTTGNFHHWFLVNEMNELLKQYEGKMLENVTITRKAKSPLETMDEKYTSGFFSGGDGYQFNVVNDNLANASPNIFFYLQSKVAGLQINTASTPPSMSWRGGTPGFYVDEVQTDASMVSSIPVADIAYIKVFRPPFMGGGFGGGNGAIAIYTRRGDDIQSAPGKGLNNNTITGYSVIREFYSPNYDNFKQENERKDIRTTLYWNPQVITAPGKNQATVTFYNNDVTKSFRVTIEGMTRDGQLAHLVQIME
ncbi:MAG: hypothetical protein B6D37_04280 [Sphingobacteriales bacterium UTBCD1]|nr:MAG: hypothetical protein B6D37_04280 [Sphingobacteriales bacterium UTBCD1]